MKTDDLIVALTADAETVSPPIKRTLWLAAGVGAVGAAILFFSILGLRPNLAASLAEPRFLFKWLLTLTLVASAMVLVLQLARPETVPGARFLALVAAPALLAAGIGAELISMPSSDWVRNLLGSNALFCMVFIPMLSALPLAALIYALRQGASAQPALAGAVAGLAAAGIGATLYATHCQDDSPLFMAVWYVVAVIIVSFAGAILGARLLRW